MVFNLFRKNAVSIIDLYTSSPELPQKIKSTVYQTWKSPYVGRKHAKHIRQFRQLNPEYSFRFFDDDEMASYMEENYNGTKILNVFKSVKIPAAKADIWRYCILYREGGVYCDIDSSLSVPLREFIHEDHDELLSFESSKYTSQADINYMGTPYMTPPIEARAVLQHPDNTILNWLMMFSKGHPILSEVIGLIETNADFFIDKEFESTWKAVIHSTGPLALTQATWRWIQKENRTPTQVGIDFNGLGIFKLPGSDERYLESPNYSQMHNQRIALTDSNHS